MRAGARKERQKGTGGTDRERQITEEWERAFYVEEGACGRARERKRERWRWRDRGVITWLSPTV